MDEGINAGGYAAYFARVNKIHEAIRELGGFSEYLKAYGLSIECAFEAKPLEAYCMDSRITGLAGPAIRTPGNNICRPEEMEAFAGQMYDAGVRGVLWHPKCGAGRDAYFAKENIPRDYDGDSKKNLGKAIDEYVKDYTRNLARTMKVVGGEEVYCREIPFDALNKNPFDARVLYVTSKPFNPVLCGLPPGLVLGGAPRKYYDPIGDSEFAANLAFDKMHFSEKRPFCIVHISDSGDPFGCKQVVDGLKRIAATPIYHRSIVVEDILLPECEPRSARIPEDNPAFRAGLPPSFNVEEMWRNMLRK